MGSGEHWEVTGRGLGGTVTGFLGAGRLLGGGRRGTGGNWSLLGCHRRVPGELAFVVGCLGVNPKSYGAWHHRGWVLRRAPTPPPAPAERALCDRLLAADPRNCECLLGRTGRHWAGVWGGFGGGLGAVTGHRGGFKVGICVLAGVGVYWFVLVWDRRQPRHAGLYWDALGGGFGGCWATRGRM